MTNRVPRPRLRDGVGRSKAGRWKEFTGERVDLVAYDLPIELSGAGRLQWLQFAADPMPWWTEADLSTVAQYCAALDAVERARDGSAAGFAAASRELRMLADQLGLTPMARARMGLSKPSANLPVWPAEESTGCRKPIPIDELLRDDD